MQALVDTQQGRLQARARGTGSTTPSRSGRRSTRSTTRRSSRTSSSTACCRTASSSPRTSSTGSPSRSATTSRSTSPTCASSRCSTPTASRSALFYADYFKRDNKNGGAWMNAFVDQSRPPRRRTRSSSTSATSRSPRRGSPRSSAFDDVPDDVPRVRPRAARAVLEREVPDARGHQRAARLRRVPVAVQRALGARSRRCSPTTPSTTRPARRCRPELVGEDREDAQVQPGLRDDRVPRPPRSSTWPGTRCRRGRRRRTSTRSRPRRSSSFKVDFAARAAALPDDLLRAHLGRRLRGGLLRLPVERGARRTTPTAGSSSTAA